MSGGGEERDDTLRALFDRAAEIDPLERARWLESNVADAGQRAALARLLDADARSEGYLDTPADLRVGLLDSDEPHVRPDGLIGTRIGPFRLLRLLGQGGMAAVFLGEREGADFGQRCAVKLLRRGLYSDLEQALFQRERRVLAALEHPNIARLVDGGVTPAGIPFLAMEFVDGEPITTYADRHGLDLRARMRLLATAAHAVDAAHQRFIVHRDLKPSNLLVTGDGTLKLVDFGIAKLLDDDDGTRTRMVGLYTPGYAAPEQRDGGTITTATDVYALGVVLHELLLGCRPAERSARRPSTVAAQAHLQKGDDAHVVPGGVTARRLRGDVDNIVLKALEHEPARRYPGAGEFAADLERHLDGLPVAAHPRSRAYVARKFVQRHLLPVAVAGVLGACVLAAAGIALWQAREARAQARIAQAEAQRANAARDFLVGLFDAAGSGGPAATRPTLEQLVDKAVLRVRSEPMPDPARAELMVMLARVSNATGQYAQAERLSRDALAILARTPAADPDAALGARITMAEAMRTDGRYADGAREVDALLPALRARDSRTTAYGAIVAANVLVLSGRHDEGVEMARLSAARHARVFGPNSPEALRAALFPGLALAAVKRFEEARAVLEPGVERLRAAEVVPDTELMNALQALASIESARGAHARAEDYTRRALEIARGANAVTPERVPVILANLGNQLTQQERFAEAAPLLQQAIAMQSAVAGPEATVTGRAYLQRASLFEAMQRTQDAEADLRRAIGIFERSGFVKSEQYPRAYYKLASVLAQQGRTAEARVANDRALAVRRELFGPDHPETGYSLALDALLALEQGDRARAQASVRASRAILDTATDQVQAEALRALALQARVLGGLGEHAQALQQADRLVAERRRQPAARLALAQALALQAALKAQSPRTAPARTSAR